MARRVRTPAGAEFYGQPIGTVITADILQAARARARAKAAKTGAPGALAGARAAQPTIKPGSISRSGNGSGTGPPGPGVAKSALPSKPGTPAPPSKPGSGAPVGPVPGRPGLYRGTGRVRYRLHPDGALTAFRGAKKLELPISVEQEVRNDIIDGRLEPFSGDFVSKTGMRYTIDGDKVRAHGPDGREYRVPTGVDELVRDDILAGKLRETNTPKAPEREARPSLLEGKRFKVVPPKPKEPEAAEAETPAGGEAKPTKPAPLKKSANETVLVTDQDGALYVFKPARTDAAERSHIELLGHELADLWEYETAHADITEINGRSGLVQALIPNVGDLEKFDFANTTALMAEGLAKEQVLDWMLDNDDSHTENFLLRADGSLVGIDKGRTYRHFGGWDGLSTTETANTNTDDLAYTKFFDAVRAGSVSREVVEAGAKAAIEKAKVIASTDDILLTAMIEAQMQFRKDWRKPHYVTWWDGDTPSNTQELIDGVLDRKRTLVKDITAMWDRVRNEIPASQDVVTSTPMREEVRPDAVPGSQKE